MIPKILKKNGKEYKLTKEYPTYGLYEATKFKYKECFSKQELGVIKAKAKSRNINPEKVMYL